MINCTGTCLCWAVETIRNPPFYEDQQQWKPWSVSAEDLVSFSAVCSDVNDLGCGYLHWDFVATSLGADMLGKTSIDVAHSRYAYCLKHFAAENLVALRPDLVAFFDILDRLHRRCQQLPIVVYTLHSHAAGDGSEQIRVATLSGVAVSEVKVSREQPLNPWDHVPQPLYRIARDRNLYTRSEFEAYYGKEDSIWMWTRMVPCYDHVMAIVNAEGEHFLEPFRVVRRALDTGFDVPVL